MPTYGCHNKPRPHPKASYVAQVAWGPVYQDGFGEPCRHPVWANVKTKFDASECQYTKTHAADKLCAGCVHQHKG